jgi:hypothetical protein
MLRAIADGGSASTLPNPALCRLHARRPIERKNEHGRAEESPIEPTGRRAEKILGR